MGVDPDRGYDDLCDRGFVVCDRFIAPPVVRALVRCAALRRERGDFLAARIGAGNLARRDPEVRGDHTCWLIEPLLAAERELLREFERLRLAINRTAFLGLFDLEAHYAWYPPGAGYARHIDQLRGREPREISLVLYLNEGWTREAGGELRLFDGAGGHRDVEPTAGRLVYFRTADREHAVLPTHRDRLSIAGWFRRRPAAAGAISAP